MDPHISLPAEPVLTLFNVPVTNATLTALVLTVAFALLGWWLKRGMGMVPSKPQIILEELYKYILEQLENAFPTKEQAKKFLPFYLTMLLFILVANQLSLIPIIFQIVSGETPLLRLPTSDLSLTIGLAAFVVIFANILAFKAAPIGHLGKFINIKGFFSIKKPGDFGQALLDLFLGLMDIVSEIAKILSLSFRLFGNIFAGEVMVGVIVSLSAFTMFIVPIPFIFLSVFAGVIQAFVFVLLSIEFIAGTIREYQTEEQEV